MIAANDKELCAWVKVKNFPNPELFKIKTQNLQYVYI